MSMRVLHPHCCYDDPKTAHTSYSIKKELQESPNKWFNNRKKFKLEIEMEMKEFVAFLKRTTIHTLDDVKPHAFSIPFLVSHTQTSLSTPLLLAILHLLFSLSYF